jgi:alkanesulfonate monooxygenase SsuD/methylene tetrahydromethanopterin reductase-like flavin-dependent oxidoreductase (luciferase family)
VKDSYRTVWVVLPNSYYDPRKGHALYNRYLDELELCAELGFDGVCVNEHHQNAYGLMPSPVVMASALARRTRDCRIAILGNAFCLREHPLTLAEEHAMLDVMTGGRLISGFVRGVGSEYFSFGTNPVHSLERHQEAHDLVVRAWTEPGPFAFEGKHYHCEYVNLWPRPYQQPHPPIWCPSMGSVETLKWAAHPDRKYVYLQAYSPVDAVARYLNLYRELAQRRYGYEASSDRIGWSTPVYVAQTDAQAVDEARAHRGAVQCIPAQAIGADVLSSRLHVAGITQARARRQARTQGWREDRAFDRAWDHDLRQPRHGPPAHHRVPPSHGVPGARLHAAVRHAAWRSDGEEHPAVRVRGDAGDQDPDRSELPRLRTAEGCG